MKLATLLIPLAAVALVAACDERPTPSATNMQPNVASPSAGPTPVPTPAPPTTPDPTPRATAGANAAETATAKDTKENDPMGTLTKKEESSAMPMAGQVNNHSSPAVEKGKP